MIGRNLVLVSDSLTCLRYQIKHLSFFQPSFMLKFDKVIKCCRGVVILHDTLLVVYEVTKLVQHYFHAKVIEVKKAFRSCGLTSII